MSRTTTLKPRCPVSPTTLLAQSNRIADPARRLASDVLSWPLCSRREIAMIVVIAKVRARSPQAVQEMCRLMRHAYALYQQPGWLRGRCVASTSNPEQVVLVEEWGSLAAFNAWWNSPARANYDLVGAQLLVGPVQLEVYEEV
jgi:heme-degrading monooxygenase HmoA